MKKRRRRSRRRILRRSLIAVIMLGTCLMIAAIVRFPTSHVSLLFEPESPCLLVPVAGVRPSHLVDTFGAPRSGGRSHQGIDIFAKKGQPVRSTTHGVALSVGENHLGGRTVSVLGPRYRRHYYAHLQTYGEVRQGQWIEAGHFIGTVGNSGNAKSTPPHLHYAIYGLFATPIDPYPLLRPKAVYTSEGTPSSNS